MRTSTRNHIGIWAACILTLTATALRADQLQMQNGDRYAGKILSVTSNSVVMESDVLGKVTLPRDKIFALTFGSSTATNAAPTAPSAPASAAITPTVSATNTDLSAAFHNLGADTNFIQQVRQQMLAGANPQANQKYDELVGGLMSGKMDLNDLRNEAKASIEQINQLKRELGPEADASLDSYLAILQNFVNESTPSAAAPSPSAPSPTVTFGTNHVNSVPNRPKNP